MREIVLELVFTLQISLKSTHCGIYLRFISTSFGLI